MNDTSRVTVPIEPTPEMTMAGAGCLPAVDGVFGLAGELSANVYRAMLSAAPAPEGGAVDGPEDDELPGDFLARVGMDGALWADGFRKMALKLGYSDMDEGWLIGWFCNAVMAGYDHAQRRFDPALATREEAPAEAGEAVEVWVVYGDDHDYDMMSQWLVGVYSTEAEAEAAAEADRKRYVAEGGSKDRPCYDISSTRLNLRAQPQAREEAQPVYALEVVRDPTVEGAKRFVGVTHPAPDALRVAVEALWPLVVAMEDFLNEPQRRTVNESFEVCDYRHEAYRVWSPLCKALAALQAEQGAK